MRRVMLLALLSLALPTATLASSVTIDFSVIPLGPGASYTGANLQSSTAFNFGSGPFVVNALGAGDQSGLTFGNTILFTPMSITYGAGDSGSISRLSKSWTGSNGTFTETFTSFTADRTATNAITLTLLGTVSGPGAANGEQIALILGANQAAGPPSGAVSWSLTEFSTGVTAVPEPGALEGLLFGTGLIGLAEMARRKLVPGT